MVRRDVVENMPVDYQQVAPAVIIEIEKSRAEGAVE